MGLAKDVAYPYRCIFRLILEFWLNRDGQRLSSLFARRQGSDTQTRCERVIRIGAHVHGCFAVDGLDRIKIKKLDGGWYCERKGEKLA
jgi:hypothetical protein